MVGYEYGEQACHCEMKVRLRLVQLLTINMHGDYFVCMGAHVVPLFDEMYEASHPCYGPLI